MKIGNIGFLWIFAALTALGVYACASDSSDGESSASCQMACHVYAECSGCEYADADKALDSCHAMCGDLTVEFEQTILDEVESCSECVNTEMVDSCDLSIMNSDESPCATQCSVDGVAEFQQKWSELLEAEDDARYEDFKCQGCSGSSLNGDSEIVYSCNEMAESAGKCTCEEGPQQGKEFDFVDPCFNEGAEEQLMAECE